MPSMPDTNTDNNYTMYPDVDYDQDYDTVLEEITHYLDYIEVPDDAEIVHVDFSYRSTDDKKGGDTFLYGFEIAKCDFQYSGCMQVYTVDDVPNRYIKAMKKFIKENPVLGDYVPNCYIYVNKEG